MDKWIKENNLTYQEVGYNGYDLAEIPLLKKSWFFSLS